METALLEPEVFLPEEQAAKSVSMNCIDAIVAEMPQIDCPVEHRFTDGMYARQIRMPAGSIITSKIHKKQHQYVVTQGVVSVFIDGVGVKVIRAPYFGITEAGTRRALYIHEDTVWTTFHPTKETDLEKVEEDLIHPHQPANPELAQRIYASVLKEELK